MKLAPMLPTLAAALVALAVPFAAAAVELRPLQPGTFVLGTHTASIYYTVQGEAYEVVTTVAPNGGASEAPGAPARFVAALLSGQKARVAIGVFAMDDTPLATATVLEVARKGDRLSATVLPVANAAAF